MRHLLSLSRLILALTDNKHRQDYDPHFNNDGTEARRWYDRSNLSIQLHQWRNWNSNSIQLTPVSTLFTTIK